MASNQVKYFYMRYHARYVTYFDTVEDAMLQAMADENNFAASAMYVVDGDVEYDGKAILDWYNARKKPSESVEHPTEPSTYITYKGEQWEED